MVTGIVDKHLKVIVFWNKPWNLILLFKCMREPPASNRSQGRSRHVCAFPCVPSSVLSESSCLALSRFSVGVCKVRRGVGVVGCGEEGVLRLTGVLSSA